MDEKNYISSHHYPVTFNPVKHHLGYILQQIKEWKKMEWPVIERELLLMGNNMLDLYFGSLSVSEIVNECHHIFYSKNINTPRQLSEWLYPFEYRKITLSDSSVWVVKKGTDNEKFIHIHPAKYSPFSVRARATTLKTVAALKTKAAGIQKDNIFTIQTVNKIRTGHLNLSPVKTLVKDKGIARLWTIFSKTEV